MMTGNGQPEFYLVNRETSECDFGPFPTKERAETLLEQLENKSDYEIGYGYMKMMNYKFQRANETL